MSSAEGRGRKAQDLAGRSRGAGVLSQVPGGIGVFESAMILLLGP